MVGEKGLLVAMMPELVESLAAIPVPVQYAVFGDEFPTADVEAMREQARGYRQAGRDIERVREYAASVIARFPAVMVGSAGQEAVAAARRLEAASVEQERMAVALAQELETATADLEKTQWEMAVFGLMVTYQIVALAAGGPAGVTAGQAVLAGGRARFLSMLAGLVSRLAAGGTRGVAMRAGMYAAVPSGVDALAQGVQIVQGHRGGWDVESVLLMGIEGAAGGVGGELVAGAVHSRLRSVSQRLRHVLAQVGGGMGGVLGGSAAVGVVTGQFSMTLPSLVNGLAMGMAAAGSRAAAGSGPGLGGDGAGPIPPVRVSTDAVSRPGPDTAGPSEPGAGEGGPERSAGTVSESSETVSEVSGDSWHPDTAALIDESVGSRPPIYDDLRRSLQDLADRHPDLADWREIGRTRADRPMDMLTIHGDSPNPHNVLLIIDPHPMEPIGRASAYTLAEHVLANPQLRADTSYHIIVSSDPDSSVLNAPWPATEGPVDMAEFHLGIHLAGMREQPDWTFPTSWFDEPLPETRAQMSVIDELRPSLMVSRHNCDLDHAHLTLTLGEDRTAAAVVPRIPDMFHTAAERHGLPISEHVTDLVGFPSIGPGVFLRPSLPDTPPPPAEPVTVRRAPSMRSDTAAWGLWSRRLNGISVRLLCKGMRP
ncbi:M14 family zinc carboxypeptidase [Nocardia sp. CY41]|uniref:M14 family zinc carboxypeptidase n=1 Tax=Nocardia sp. CY41 TaxID=2608686 RepID=UPI0013582243|nr:M14 family zinc carboxypeptidase [Nocardia sp. CY41]